MACERGTFCPEGSATPTYCPVGTYNDLRNRSSKQDCLLCSRVHQGEHRTTVTEGSTQCDACMAEYFDVESRQANATIECASCPESGANCSVNSTLSSLEIVPGFWRLSPRARTPLACAGHATDSPCLGGPDAGVDGRGYCRPGHRGPLCSVCEEPQTHVDERTGRCEACPDLMKTMGVPAAIVALSLAVVAGLVALAYRSPKCARLGVVSRLRLLWGRMEELHLVPTIKQLVAFYQVAVVCKLSNLLTRIRTNTN